MKHTTHLLLLSAILILFSCKKTSDSGKPLPELIAATSNQVIAPLTTYYNFKYGYGTKSMTLLCSFKLDGNTGTLTLTNTTGNITYFRCNINETTLVTYNVEMPNLIPFDNILPVGTDRSWASCMKAAIKICAVFPLCANGTCAREAIVGCLAGWSVKCLWFYGIQMPVPLVIINPHPF